MEEDSIRACQISLKGLEGISQPVRHFSVTNSFHTLFALIPMVALKGVIPPIL